MPAVGVSAQVMDKVLDILGTDSLSAVHQTKGMPVVVEEDTLFYFYAKRGGLTP